MNDLTGRNDRYSDSDFELYKARELRMVLWTGGNAPHRNSQLKVSSDGFRGFVAYWEPGFCGCPDCHPLVGAGATEQEAIDDYWERWEDNSARFLDAGDL
jgi:hypothetical protein